MFEHGVFPQAFGMAFTVFLVALRHAEIGQEAGPAVAARG